MGKNNNDKNKKGTRVGENGVSLHLLSSDPSVQSSLPSHFHLAGMHSPLSTQRNWSNLQVMGTSGKGRAIALPTQIASTKDFFFLLTSAHSFFFCIIKLFIPNTALYNEIF